MEENQQLQYEQQFEPIVDPNMEPITDPNDVPRGSAIASMILGIASLATSGSVPVAGIVLAAIARAKANAFLREHPNTSASGFAKAGRIMGNIGLPLSIVMTVITALAFVLGIYIGLNAPDAYDTVVETGQNFMMM